MKMRQKLWFVVSLLLLLGFLEPRCLASPNLDSLSDSRGATEEASKSSDSRPGCCNHTEPGHHVEVQFSSKVVQNEYIVTFIGYFSAEEREEHIKRALNGSKGSVSIL